MSGKTGGTERDPRSGEAAAWRAALRAARWIDRCVRHKSEWVPARRRGNLYTFRCNASVLRQRMDCRGTFETRCPNRLGIVQGGQGFVGKPGGLAVNQSKASVLAILSRGPATARTISAASGLSKGQTTGVLSRCERWGWVERGEFREAQPVGMAFVWRLTDRGIGWLRWAAQEGLVQAASDGS